MAGPATASPADTQARPAPGVRLRRVGVCGRVTLDRPRALNALTHAMVVAITTALLDWQDDDGIRLVLIDATGPRAFCAGGDIGEVHAHVAKGDLPAALGHCRAEYALDLLIAGFEKPVVTLVEGVAMGGGIGLACHASHVVAGGRARFAFPECAIGWIPDSGATHLLAGPSPALARYLALTGAPVGAADAVRLGLAHVLLREGTREDLVAELERTGDPATISRFGEPVGDAATTLPPPEVLEAFAVAKLPAIVRALERLPAGERPLGALRRGSPLAQSITLVLLEEARRSPGLAEAIARETRMISTLLDHADFHEGIRASLIDRDRRPAWVHAHARGVPGPDLARILAGLGAPLGACGC